MHVSYDVSVVNLDGYIQLGNVMKSWEYRKMPLEQRLELFTRIDQSGCHFWQGAIDSHGYGQIRNAGSKKMLAHRLIWKIKYGELLASQQVLHRCDNPACVNIEHLFIGDNAINMADKKAKGRSGNVPRGFAHTRPMAKLTNEKVVEIKSLLRRGYKQCDIAKDFGVSRQIISDIYLRKTWFHIE